MWREEWHSFHPMGFCIVELLVKFLSQRSTRPPDTTTGTRARGQAAGPIPSLLQPSVWEAPLPGFEGPARGTGALQAGLE